VAGGLAGLFLLAFLSDRANRQGAYVGIGASLAFTLWAMLTLNRGNIVDLGRYNFPLHDYMIGVIGNIVLLVVGYFASFLFRPPDAGARELTLWGWLQRNRSPVMLKPLATMK
jgi:SSS family solute:Na+ symporter